jgi:thermitase
VRPQELIVQYTSYEAFLADTDPGGEVIDEAPGLNSRLIRVADVLERADELEGSPDVLRVTENPLIGVSYDPNDEYYQANQQWHLKEWASTYGSDLRRAWDRTAGYRGGRLIIVDTGVDPDHTDLQAKDPKGWNFNARNAQWADCFGHGTSVAGTAAAVTNNGRGVASADMWARIYVAKVNVGCNDAGDLWALARGIDESSRWPDAKVMNISLGAYNSADGCIPGRWCIEPSEVSYLKTAIDNARSRNVVIVVAAGNENVKKPSYPAAFAGVLAVGATGPSGERAAFSNWGSPNVDVSAPGISICTTALPEDFAGILLNEYDCPNGTSFASPLVAGIAMLVRSRYPNETEGQIRSRIQRASWNPERRCWNCYSDSYGYGVVQASYAVR